MNAIIGMADFIEESTPAEERSEAMAIIKDSGQALLTLINDILDLAKIESGEAGLAMEEFSPRDLIESVRSIMHYPAEVQKKLRLVIFIAPDVPQAVLGDFRRIRQILINLVGNATKFTERGQIVISLKTEAMADGRSSLLFSVKDTGIGIPEERLDAIFENFVQVDRTISQQYGGTGLGLAISKRLVEAMEGKIWVESATGRGSEFLFVIPMATVVIDDPVEPVMIDAGNRDDFSVARGTAIPPDTRILLAEDDPINQLVFLKMFKRLGLSPDLAQNGLEVLEMASDTAYDLIFMDVQMPVMDGINAVKELRALERRGQQKHHTRVVALTAFALEDDDNICLKAGMDDYLSKPVNSHDLQRIILRWLGDEHKTAGLVDKEQRNASQLIDTNTLLSLHSEVGEEEFGAIVKIVVMRLFDLTDQIRESSAADDMAAMGRAAHSLKGSSLQIGAVKLADIANTLENQANARTAEKNITVSALEEVVENSRSAIEDFVQDVLQ